MGAFMIDILLLAAVGNILGTAFMKQVSALGTWGNLFGYGVVICYFGYFDSDIAKVKSPGKQLFKIEVRDIKGNKLSVKKASIRAAVLFSFIYLWGIELGNHTLNASVEGISLALSITNMALLLITPTSRQGLHDLIMKTYVVMTRPVTEVREAVFPKTGWLTRCIAFGIGILMLGFSFYLSFGNIQVAGIDFKILAKVNESITNREDIHTSSIIVVQNSGDGGRELDIVLVVKEPGYLNTDFALDILDNVERWGVEKEELVAFNVVLTYGFDLGISSYHKLMRVRFIPNEEGFELESVDE